MQDRLDQSDRFVSCSRCRKRNAEFNPRCRSCGEPLAARPGPLREPAEVGQAAVKLAPDGAAEAVPGRCISHYRVLHRLGQGGMGVVYRAEDQRTGSAVALKTVAGADAEMLPRIRREILVLARIRHPGIVRILDSGTQDGLPWYAMELVEGVTLRRHASTAQDEARTAGAGPSAAWWTQFLVGAAGAPGHVRSARALDLEEAHGNGRRPRALEASLTLVRRLCAPLAYLHGEGIVHRDLKPENILIRAARGDRRAASSSERGKSWLAASALPVIVDFGLAADLSGGLGRERLLLETELAGTVAYMAPEQLRGEPLDARADLYALGCILYELLTGRPPFQGGTAWEVIDGHLHGSPGPPSALTPGVEPILDDLVLRLLAKHPRDRLGHADDVAAALAELGAGSGQGRRAPRPRAYLYRPGFAGREEALGVLEQRLERLLAGSGGLALVAGESGVGKTRLLAELARRAASRGIEVLAGECFPGATSRELRVASEQRSDSSLLAPRSSSLASASGSARASRGRLVRETGGPVSRSPSLDTAWRRPLEALRKPLQAISDRCRALGAEETERLLGRRGKVLALYEPALRGLPGQEAYPEPVELPPEATRLRLFGDLAETLAAMAEAGPDLAARGTGKAAPLLLLLDDLQWADDLTVGFLEHWQRAASARTAAAGSVLVLGTYRSEDLRAADATALQRLVDAGGTDGIAPLQLGRLGETEVGAIVGDMLALAPPPALFARHVAGQSEGNPFFVAEYLRAAVAKGLLWRDRQGRWQVAADGDQATQATYDALSLPRSLRELVAARLQTLGRGGRRLVQAAAVLGRECQPEVLRTMMGAQQDGPWLAALNELLSRQVLEEPRPGRLRFTHDKLREVTYEDLRRDRCRKLHHAAAEAIETLHAEDPAEQQAVLGHHWEQAGVPDKARPCYLTAARQARTQSAHAEAERLYRAYLRQGEQTTRESIEARVELGLSLSLRGRYDAAVQEYDLALLLARGAGDRDLQSSILRGLGAVQLRTKGGNQARQLFQEALDLDLQTGDWQSQSLTLGNLAQAIHMLGQTDEALLLYEQALVLRRQAGNRKAEGSILGNLGGLYTQQGRLDEARQSFEQELALHRELGDPFKQGFALGNLGTLYLEQGHVQKAQEHFEQALALHREAGDRPSEGLVLSNLACLHAEQDQLEQAQRLFGQALDLHLQTGNRRSEAVVLGNLASLHVDQGRLDEARQLGQRALDLHRQTGNRRFEALTLASLARVELLRADDPSQAEVLATEAERIATAMGEKPILAKILVLRGQIALARNRGANEDLDRAQRLATEMGVGSQSGLGRAVENLRHAIEAFDAGRPDRLFQGELIEDLPEGLRRQLAADGRIPAGTK